MATDFQVVYLQESIKLNSVQLTTVGGLSMLKITGEDFRALDEVVINDIPSPDVIVVSRTQLLAQVPDVLQENPEIRDVMVLSNRFTFSTRSLLRFRIGKRPGKVRGLQRLVQLFIKVLFTTPGSDIFNKGAGGGIMNKVGTTFGADDTNNMVTDFVVAVNRVQRQIVAAQSRDQRSPREERLMSAVVTGSSFDKTQGAFYITIELYSQAGRVAAVTVEA